MGIPSEVLHLATTYVDRYIWLKTTEPGKCTFLAAAALWVAIKTATAQLCLRPELMCELAKNSFTKEQVFFCASPTRLCHC